MKKTVFITGAGSGLGNQAAILLAKRGHKVIATTRYQVQADELNNLAKEKNLPIESFKLDILLEEDRNKVLDYNFDVLINNAAISDSGSVAEIRVDRFENVFETNVFSNIKFTQIALKKMIFNGHGRIVFLSSLAGKISIPFLAPYCASKFAIEGFCEALRYEMKILKEPKIEIVLIEPGAYATGFNKDSYERKYTWMKEGSYFQSKLEKIRNIEEKLWNFGEYKKFDSIVKQYVKAVESKKPKFRYKAPKSQAILIQIGRIFGM